MPTDTGLFVVNYFMACLAVPLDRSEPEGLQQTPRALDLRRHPTAVAQWLRQLTSVMNHPYGCSDHLGDQPGETLDLRFVLVSSDLAVEHADPSAEGGNYGEVDNSAGGSEVLA